MSRRTRVSWDRPHRSSRRAALVLLRRLRLPQREGVVVEDRREPALGLRHVHALAPRVILDLIALDLGDAEIRGLGMREVEAR